MKLFARPKCLAETTAPLVTVVRFLGLRAFEFRGRPQYIISLIYLLVLYIFYCCSLHVQHKYYSNVKMLKLESVLHKLQMYITSASILVKLLLGWWCTEKYKVCHQKLNAIDETLRQLGLTVNYDGIHFIMMEVMALWIVIVSCGWIAAFFALQGHTSLLNILYTVSMYMYGISTSAIIVLEFIIFVKCIRMKFELINRFLWKNLGASLSTNDTKLGLFRTDDFANIVNYERRRHAFAWNILKRYRRKSGSRMISVIGKQSLLKSRDQSRLQSRRYFQESARSQQQKNCFAKIIRRKCLLQIIKQMHLELCKISKTLCTIFGVQIAWEIGFCIEYLTKFFYSRYVNHYKQHNLIPHFTERTILSILLSILCILLLILVSRVCKTTADEGNKTIDIIHSTYEYVADSDLTEEIQQFGIQILQSPVAFTAVGLPLDNTILTMSLRCITTYLVIMIQVSNSLESNKTIPHAHL